MEERTRDARVCVRVSMRFEQERWNKAISMWERNGGGYSRVQGMSLGSLAARKKPSSHRHSVRPVAGAVLCAGHLAHASSPVAGLYLPIGHTVTERTEGIRQSNENST